jgi:hypothetical protein
MNEALKAYPEIRKALEDGDPRFEEMIKSNPVLSGMWQRCREPFPDSQLSSAEGSGSPKSGEPGDVASFTTNGKKPVMRLRIGGESDPNLLFRRNLKDEGDDESE